VVRTVEALFGTAGPEGEGSGNVAVRRNRQGGCAVHLQTLTSESLKEALDAVKVAYDVVFESGRMLRCIHKRWNGRHIYFFANLDPKLSASVVLLRGRHDLEAWDPHTGEIRPVQATHDLLAGTDFTRISLSLPYLKSLFLVTVSGTG